MADIHGDTLELPFSWLTDTVVDKWLIFVDEAPQKNWKHPCSYFYVPKQSDSVAFHRVMANKPPKISLKPYSWVLRAIQTENPISVPPKSVEPFDPAVDSCDSRFTNDCVALVVATGDLPWTNYARFMRDANYFCKVLNEKYNFCPFNLFLLHGSRHFGGDALDTHTNTFVTEQSLFDYESYGLETSPFSDDPYNNYRFYATYENVKRMFQDIIQNRLAEDKHFVFFYSGHGDNEGGFSLSLPGDTLRPTEDDQDGFQTVPLYASELKNLLDSVSCRMMTVILGQCYAGGFIDSLAAPNRVILAACQPDEVSYGDNYDVFLHNLTNAFNECDSLGAVNSDIDGNGRVTMKEAFEYAQSCEVVTDYGHGNIYEEHPMYSSLREAVGEDLAMDYLPERVDLFIRDNEDDTGKEYNLTDSVACSSPDIWLRNQNDGLTNHNHEDVTTTGESKVVYIYVRLSNRGIDDYQYANKKLTLYWTTRSLDANATGTVYPNLLLPACGIIGSYSLNSYIESDSSLILGYQWTIPASLCQPCVVSGSIPIGLLAVIGDTLSTVADEQVIRTLYDNRTRMNDVALRNMNIIKTNPGGDIGGPIIIGVSGAPSASQITVTLSEPAPDDAYLTINPTTVSNPILTQHITDRETTQCLTTDQLPTGVYVVSLSVGGQTKNSVKFLK